MNRSKTRVALASAAALFAASAAVPASAAYLGYGNGDPGNWDLWTEQNGGRNPEVQAQTRTHTATPRSVHHAHNSHHMRQPRDSFGNKGY
ncbi:hypothetical protein [Hyphomicrobium sp.]|uniref:hypothetical protein n=1 Tax=Hyphomicrobium sp. TaxID=82 RepID=UPI0025C28550|nr:hypothetical protein [Hyphomicrobium sp.]MCC7251682.1 hypothetical protein [Hyphomicrobium sp.]